MSARSSLIRIGDLDVDGIGRILGTAERFGEVMERDIKKVPTLRGRTVINLFLEPSTRTSTSFELAAKRLSADVVSIKGAGTSMDKGETLKDTIRTLEAYDPDVFVVRHPQVGACDVVARHTSAAVVNAGDGTGEHPTQALLDLYTVQREIAPIEGLHVAFVGDVLFRGSIGRTDFPRGNHEQLLHSIRKKLWPLGDDVTFIPGHGPESTFGRERRSNPYVGGT